MKSFPLDSSIYFDRFKNFNKKILFAFSSDVKGPIVTDSNVSILWKWNGTSFIAPVENKIETTLFGNVEVTTSSSIQAPTVQEIEEQKALSLPSDPENTPQE